MTQRSTSILAAFEPVSFHARVVAAHFKGSVHTGLKGTVTLAPSDLEAVALVPGWTGTVQVEEDDARAVLDAKKGGYVRVSLLAYATLGTFEIAQVEAL